MNKGASLLLQIHSIYMELDPVVAPSLRIADAVKAVVLQGVVAPGEQIPSTASLARQLGVNPMTVIKSLQGVTALGIIRAVRGSNYIVCEESQKLCPEIIKGEILGELRYLHRKMKHYLIDRSQISQWLKGFEEADESLKNAKRSTAAPVPEREQDTEKAEKKKTEDV